MAATDATTATSPGSWNWAAPVTVLSGVGSERAAQLARLGIHTVEDLLLHRPRRYEDRRQVQRIEAIQELGAVATRGRVVAVGVKYFRKRTRSVFELVLDDGTGRLHCRWWDMAYRRRGFEVGQEWMVYGRVTRLKPRTMDHPECEMIESGDTGSIHAERIVPIYPLTEGLNQRWMRERVWAVVQHVTEGVEERYPAVSREGMPSRRDALRSVHFPESAAEAEAARRRLAFDEFVELQMAIQLRRARLFAHIRGLPCHGDNRWVRPFLGRLGFRLTEGQTNVLRELRTDLSSGRPMRRLVQGDVGSGKTAVAAATALMVLESGYSVALMAPTDLLARQHWRKFQQWFEPLGIPVHLHTGEVKSDGVKHVEADAQAMDLPGLSPSATGANGPAFFVGTHALIASGFARDDLGLVIIDEQHKFGVAQREALVRKGRYPHLLVMTATPIPRTLALTLYGDLDVSTISDLPPGRGRVRTFVRNRDKLPKVWDFVRDQLRAGRQAYIVFPRIDDSGTAEVKALSREFATLCAVFDPYPVRLVHGRMPSAERERVMDDFRMGRVGVLVATLVIEVGVDVPNATVMVIENAERFGLAQLHQLRGRIGRGSEESYCVLITSSDSEEAQARLNVLVENSDGFAIAEADLRLRGPGELLGQSQSGLPRVSFGDWVADRPLLERARNAVAEAIRSGEG